MEISFASSTTTQNEWSSSSATAASPHINGDAQDGLIPVINFLQSTLAMKARGDDLHYQTLVAQLMTRDDPPTLWRLYLGMCHCVTVLTQQPHEFKELIDAVFRFDWRGDDRVVGAFGTLMSHLVSANGTYMLPAMHMLFRSLVLAPFDLDEEGNVDPQALIRQRRVHETLRASLILVPSGRSKLFGVLRQNYPHRRLRAEVLSDYVLQALRIVQYAPLIEESVVRLIVEKSLEMDVEIKIMDNGEAALDDDKEEESEALFTMDGLTYGDGDRGGTAAGKNTPAADEVNEMAEKLDGVMLVLFTYLEHRLGCNASMVATAAKEDFGKPPDGGAEGAGACDSGGVDSGKEGAGSQSGGKWRQRRISMGDGGVEVVDPVDRLLQSLLLVFDERILPTHRSKFVQFVLFFACGRAPGLRHALPRRLVDVFTDETKPKLTRQSGVAYLASYLARASFLEASAVSSAVSTLLQWAKEYADLHDDVMAMPAPLGVIETPGAKAFKTPIGSRVRVRARSWHGANSNPLGGTTGSRDGGVASPKSALLPVSGKSGTTGTDHMLFYSVCQATFYVMCFRGEELTAMDSIANQATTWQRLLTCSLQPLRHCLDTVRREFARLCVGLLEEHFQAELVEDLEIVADERHEPPSQPISVGASLSCATPRTPGSSSSTSNVIITSTNRSRSAWGTPSRKTRAGGLGQGWNPLDSFFPFDPFLLRRSHVFVGALYNTWKAPEDRKTRPLGRYRGGDSSAQCVDINSESDIDSHSHSESDSLGSHSMDAASLSYKSEDGHRSISSTWSGDGGHGAIRINGSSRVVGEGREQRAREAYWKRLAAEDVIVGSAASRRAGFPYTDNDDMSMTPGSLVSKSMGKEMMGFSMLADEGLLWGGVVAAGGGSVDDAFFHENVSPSASPPIASALMNDHSPAMEVGVGLRRARY